MIPKSKLLVEKTLFPSEVLIRYERNIRQEVPLKFEDQVSCHFPLLQVTFKIGFWYAIYIRIVSHVDEVIR